MRKLIIAMMVVCICACKKPSITANAGKKTFYHIEGSDTISWVCFPNTFTPDGDGVNDLYQIIVENVPRMNLELNIVDKKGAVIFYSGDAYAAWDGTYKGIKSADGIYYSKIKATDTTGYVFEINGTLNLLR